MRSLEERVNELIEAARWENCFEDDRHPFRGGAPYENEEDERLDLEASRIVASMDRKALRNGEVGHWSPPT